MQTTDSLPARSTKLSGHNALITGASQGMGRCIAEHFIAAGANVVICARDEALLEKTGSELRAANPNSKILTKACDVSSEDEVSGLVNFALMELGSIEVLVNNAGVYGPMGSTEPFRFPNGNEPWKSISTECLFQAGS